MCKREVQEKAFGSDLSVGAGELYELLPYAVGVAEASKLRKGLAGVAQSAFERLDDDGGCRPDFEQAPLRSRRDQRQASVGQSFESLVSRRYDQDGARAGQGDDDPAPRIKIRG